MRTKEKRKGEKEKSKRSEKKIGNESAKKKKEKVCLMRMRESKILYNLQQKLTQNLAKV